MNEAKEREAVQRLSSLIVVFEELQIIVFWASNVSNSNRNKEELEHKIV